MKLTLETADELLALRRECEQELSGLVVALAALHGTRCDRLQPKGYVVPFWIVVNELRSVVGRDRPYTVLPWLPTEPWAEREWASCNRAPDPSDPCRQKAVKSRSGQ